MKKANPLKPAKKKSQKEIMHMIDRGEFDDLILRDIEKDTGLSLREG